MQDHSILTIYTIGHSDRPIESFISMLAAQQIQALVDVRATPYSNRQPQYQQDNLREAMEHHAIIYHWAGLQLGGMRQLNPASQHSGLPETLRSFADYMETPEFARAAQMLIHLARRSPTAIMCAERLPPHCHRSLIADYLLLQGVRVMHLINEAETEEHQLHPAARRESAALIYDQ